VLLKYCDAPPFAPGHKLHRVPALFCEHHLCSPKLVWPFFFDLCPFSLPPNVLGPLLSPPRLRVHPPPFLFFFPPFKSFLDICPRPSRFSLLFVCSSSPETLRKSKGLNPLVPGNHYFFAHTNFLVPASLNFPGPCKFCLIVDFFLVCFLQSSGVFYGEVQAIRNRLVTLVPFRVELLPFQLLFGSFRRVLRLFNNSNFFFSKTISFRNTSRGRTFRAHFQRPRLQS